MMQLAHKIRLDPNNKQITYFKKACGVSRLVWNWALEQWEKQYKASGKPNALKLKKQFNSIKRKDYPFVLKVTKYASQQPFIFLQQAYNKFFKGIGEKPKFKSRKKHNSFYIGGDQIKVNNDKVRIPKLGWVRMREELRFDGKILNATVSKETDRWYISFTVEVRRNPYCLCESQAEVGVDLGIEKLATLSDGTFFENINVLKKHERRIKRVQRQLSRRKKNSNNFKKQALKIQRLHTKTKNIRKDYLHKITTYLTTRYKTIAIENLNVSGMLKNHHLAKAISDSGFYEFRKQLEYKSHLRGNNLIIVDRWYPSSKTCSNCGYVNDNLTLSDRVFTCPNCGLVIDRDLNAAINLLNYATVGRVPPEPIRLWREALWTTLRLCRMLRSIPSLKQELSKNLTVVRFE